MSVSCWRAGGSGGYNIDRRAYSSKLPADATCRDSHALDSNRVGCICERADSDAVRARAERDTEDPNTRGDSLAIERVRTGSEQVCGCGALIVGSDEQVAPVRGLGRNDLHGRGACGAQYGSPRHLEHVPSRSDRTFGLRMPVAGWFDERFQVLDLSFLCFKALKQHLDLRRAGCFRHGFPPKELRSSGTRQL